MYGGNSPISGIDPDGEFFFLFAVAILAIGGAYIGGAKANDSWNPIKWNWESPDTYIGMGFGALGKKKYLRRSLIQYSYCHTF